MAFDRKQALDNIAKKGKVEVSVLEQELKEIEAELPPSNNKEMLALKELNDRYSGPPDNTTKFEICIFGIQQVSDFNSATFKKAKDAYKKDKSQAIENGLVEVKDGEIIVLDRQKTIDYGKGPVDNPNYGKPLAHSLVRNALVLAAEEGSEDYKITELQLRGDFATTSRPQEFKTLSCNLLGSVAEGLKTAKTSKFNAIDKKIDYNGLLQKLAKDKIVLLGDTFDEAKKHSKDEKDYFRRFIITNGKIKFIGDPKGKSNNYNGTIDDITTDKMITVFVDGDLPKPEQDTEYTFIAQSSIKKEQEKDDAGNWVEIDEEKVVLNVLGYYS